VLTGQAYFRDNDRWVWHIIGRMITGGGKLKYSEINLHQWYFSHQIPSTDYSRAT
jgi:hypothetical protein